MSNSLKCIQAIDAKNDIQQEIDDIKNGKEINKKIALKDVYKVYNFDLKFADLILDMGDLFSDKSLDYTKFNFLLNKRFSLI